MRGKGETLKKDDLDLSKGKNASKEKQRSKKYPLESPQRVGRRKLRDEKKKKKKRSRRAGYCSNTEAERARSNENDKCL